LLSKNQRKRRHKATLKALAQIEENEKYEKNLYIRLKKDDEDGIDRNTNSDS